MIEPAYCPIGLAYFIPSKNPWLNSEWSQNGNVSFLSDGIQSNGSNGQAFHFFGASSPIGFKAFLSAKWNATRNGNPVDLLGVGNGYLFGITSFFGVFLNPFNGRICISISSFTGFTGAYAIGNGDNVIVNVEYEVLSATSSKITYWVYDSTGMTLLDTGTDSRSGSSSYVSDIGSSGFGFYEQNIFAAFKIIDAWAVGLGLPNPCGALHYQGESKLNPFSKYQGDIRLVGML